MLKYLILFLFIVVSYVANAATGCVATANNIMYLQKTGSNYRSNGTTATLGVGCTWIYIGGTCNVNNGIGAGLLAQDTPQSCPIDDYVFLLMCGSLVFGYYIVKNRANTKLVPSNFYSRNKRN